MPDSLKRPFQARHIILEAGPPVYGGFTLGRFPKSSAMDFEPSLEETTGSPAQTHPHTEKVILIRGAIPGETVEVHLEEEKKDYFLASVTRVINRSDDRIEPKYGDFEACAGWQFQHIAYERQVEMKEVILSDTLRRIAGITIQLSSPLTLDDNIWHYRYRGQFKVAGDMIGFHKERTNEIVDTGYSPLMVDEINTVLKRIRGAVKENPVRVQDVYEIQIAHGDGEYGCVRIREGAEISKQELDALASFLLGLGLKGLFIGLGRKKPLRYGREFLTLPLGNLKYTVSPASFFQSNWRLNLEMIDVIKNELQPLDGLKVLDLFSGAGNFSLPLASDAYEVIAVEENPLAIQDGKRNLMINRIENVQFIRSSAESFDIRRHRPLDILLLDPPRAGLSRKLVEGILKAKPGRIVYVSCNPSTFARDVKRLKNDYHMDSIRLIDLFPQTYHIESLAFLTRAE